MGPTASTWPHRRPENRGGAIPLTLFCIEFCHSGAFRVPRQGRGLSHATDIAEHGFHRSRAGPQVAQAQQVPPPQPICPPRRRGVVFRGGCGQGHRDDRAGSDRHGGEQLEVRALRRREEGPRPSRAQRPRDLWGSRRSSGAPSARDFRIRLGSDPGERGHPADEALHGAPDHERREGHGCGRQARRRRGAGDPDCGCQGHAGGRLRVLPVRRRDIPRVRGAGEVRLRLQDPMLQRICVKSNWMLRLSPRTSCSSHTGSRRSLSP